MNMGKKLKFKKISILDRILIELPPLSEYASEIFFVQRQTWYKSYLNQVSHEDIAEKGFRDFLIKTERIRNIIEEKIDRKFFIVWDISKDKILGFISFVTQPRNEIKSLHI